MTRQEVLGLNYGQVVYDRHHKNADGTPARWRVASQVKTWKTKPDVRVSIKHGLRDWDTITLTNADRFSLTEEGADNES